MKRAGEGGGGGGAGASGTGAGGGSKRPRNDPSAAAAAEEEEEEEELIDLTTDDSPVVVRTSGPASTAAASSASSAAAAATARPPAAEPIEVSDDEEEDDEAEAYGDLFLGQVMSKVVGIQHYTGIVSRGEAVYLVREPQNRYDPNAIRALNVSNEMVGHIPAVLAALLAPIMDTYSARDFRVEGMVPDPDRNLYSMPLVLSLRGSDRAASRVQTLLAQVPRLGKGHKVIAGGTSAGGGAAGGKKKAGAGAAGPSVHNVITKELERLCASSVAYEDMPEACTPRLLRSRLHAHQAERPLNVAQAIAEQREQQQQRAAAEAAASSSAEAAAGAGKGKGKKKATAKAAAGGANSTTVFFYEERVDPSSGRTVYYNIASNSASTTPPALARGGILADDMGLGKTIEALALIAADVEEQRAAGATGGKGGGAGPGVKGQQQQRRRPTLVVCPLSVMANWEGQIEEHLKGLEALEEETDAAVAKEGKGNKGKGKGKGKGGLRVGVYHGKDRKLQALQSYDIVLTTYQILSRDLRASASSSSSGSGKQLTIAHAGKRKGLLAVNWRRVILDEAHHIKNRESLTAQAAFALEAERRWCLTGTPISNKIEDLYSLVKFLRADPFSDFSWFQRLIVRPIADRDPVGFQRLQLLVRHHALRRTKDMKVRARGPDGATVLRPLVALPPKIAQVVQLELPPEEREAYGALHALARGLFSLASDAQRQGPSTTSYAHVFSLLTRLRLLCLHPSLVPADLLEKVKRLASSTSSSSGAGAAANMDPQAAMAKALTDLGKEGVEKLLQALDAKRGESEDCSICLEELGDAGVITRCLHVYHRDCLLHALMSKNARAATDPRAPAPCPLCRQQVSMGDVLAKTPEQPKAEEEEADEDEKDEAGKEGDGGGGVKASAKMQAILARVRAIVGKPRAEGNRLALFSSFTSFLDLMGAMLSQEGIRHQRIDGSTPREKRAQITRAWSASSNEVEEGEEEDGGEEVAQVLLVSIKAGGTGLSLTAANYAIIAEPFFNPAVEDQATDRVHRIGQTRPVYIARFIVKDSVEQALLRLQEQKRQLVAASFHKSREELRRLNMQMLRSVFE